MDKILDIVGASVIWGLMMLIMIGVNSQINDHSFENLNTTITQMDAIELSEIIEFDFKKAGSHISGDKICIADSDQVKFYYDYDNNGVKDSMSYYLGNTSELSSSKNLNDKPVYRKLNNTTSIVGNITEMKLEYLDSLGQKLSYASLSSQSNMNKIKIFKITFKKEGMYPNYDSLYPAVDWVRQIKPKNL
jgi:nucleoside diphosphate kinase